MAKRNLVKRPALTEDEKTVWLNAFTGAVLRNFYRIHEGHIRGSVDEIDEYGCAEIADFVLYKFRAALANESFSMCSPAHGSVKALKPEKDDGSKG